MTADLLIPRAPPRRWHAQLALALSRAGVACAVRSVDSGVPAHLPSALEWLLRVDRTLHGGGAHALDTVPLAVSSGEEGAAEFAIDLTGGIGRATAPRHIVPLFDGAPGEAALWSSLLDGRAPRLDLYDVGQRTLIPIGLPATEAPHQLMNAADQVIARLIQGIVRTVRHGLAGTVDVEIAPTTPCLAPTRPWVAMADIFAIKGQRAFTRRFRRDPQWSVAFRAQAGTGMLPDGGPVDLSGWTVLPDDGQRYYADPFLFAHAGRRYVFVEEYPYATGRGLISVAEIGADGRVLSAPQPVLEAPFHLSYPQVFAHGGAVYMLPEAAANGRLTLYRAERFPDRWVAVGDLLDEGVHDATLHQTGDGWWLFATSDAEGGSSWDALNLYHAPDLMGPWSAHDMNPVLVDAGAARPAGAMFQAGDGLWRPVQDCRAGYGAALGFARIDRLDRGGFEQTGVHAVQPPVRGGFLGVHSWSCAAGLEAIDIFGPRPGGGR